MDFITITDKIGDSLGIATANVISYLSSLGLDVSPEVSKAIWLLILFLSVFLIVKFMEKPLKYGLIVLIAFIVFSLGVSFFV